MRQPGATAAVALAAGGTAEFLALSSWQSGRIVAHCGRCAAEVSGESWPIGRRGATATVDHDRRRPRVPTTS